MNFFFFVEATVEAIASWNPIIAAAITATVLCFVVPTVGYLITDAIENRR